MSVNTPILTGEAVSSAPADAVIEPPTNSEIAVRTVASFAVMTFLNVFRLPAGFDVPAWFDFR
jgi:hypothetical protein